METVLSAIGLLLSANTKQGQLADTPDDIILLNLNSGNTPSYSLGNRKPMLREPMMQLLVRNKNYVDAVHEVERCTDIILHVSGEVGDKYVVKITQFSDILHLGRDDKNRYMFSINFVIQIDNLKEA